MYHFMATCAPEPLELSENVHIPGHIRQYLRDFQVDTLNFLHKHLANRDFCILNDESGLGKCVSTAVYLGVLAKNKQALIVVQNDDELVTGWQFHFEVLTNLSVGVLAANTSSFDPLPNIIIAKWATLRTNVDVSKYNFDYVIVDNRGEMMNNNFCMSMLLSNYENRINFIISSVDVAADLKLLHNCLRLGGHLEHQYEQFKNFEAKYKLPSSKDVLNKTADLEQYFLKREMISDYCKDFRLRRYRHQYEDQLPLVDVERYQISLELWRTISSSNSSQRSNDNTKNMNANAEMGTEELFNQALALDREVSQIMHSRQSLGANFESNETSEEQMSPLLIDSESCSSDEPEIVNIANTEKTLQQSKQTEPDIYEFVDLSIDQNSDEYISTANIDKKIAKTNECQTKPRSPTQIDSNQKTSVENVTRNVDFEMELAESTISCKESKDAKETAAEKTNELSENFDEKINGKAKVYTKSSTNNPSETTLKKQAQNSTEKQNELTKSRKSVATEPESDKKETVIVTRRQRRNQAEKITKEAPKPIKSLVTNKDATTKDLSKKTLTKRKFGYKDANDNISNNVSPAKRSALNHSVANVNPVTNKKANIDNKKEVENSKKTTQSKADKVESNPRHIRQLRKDKSDAQRVDKNTVSPVSPKKSARSPPIATTTPTKESNKSVQVKDNNSSTNDKNNTEKRKQKDSPKTKEIPQTPSRSTRSMQRLTRSADNTKSKYMTAAKILDRSRKPKKRKAKRNATNKQEKEDSKSLNVVAATELKKSKERSASDEQHEKEGATSIAEQTIERKSKCKVTKTESANRAEAVNQTSQNQVVVASKENLIDVPQETALSTDLPLLPCSQYTEDMQCGQKIITDTPSDNGFLRPPTPVRFICNTEQKNFLSTPSSIADSEVVFVPPKETPNKTQQTVVILSSSTDDGSHSSQQSVQSRRTRVLKQKKTVKHTVAERAVERTNVQATPTTTTPTFGELLAKQRIQRKSPDIFNASTELGLTCTQQRAAALGHETADTADTFQGFKIFGSEVKQIQQQHAKQQKSSGGTNKRSTLALSRGRSCLNILEKMFDPHATADGTDDDVARTQTKTTNKSQQTSKKKPDAKLVKRRTQVNQPVVPLLPNINTTVNATQVQQQQQQTPQDNQNNKSKQKQNNNTTKNPIINDTMVDEEIFEITNNDAFGSVMRINSNGEISPVQTTIRTQQQQQTQHNKITNYLIGSSTTQLTPTETTVEERTPNKRTQMQLSGTVTTRRSPKNRLTQQTTKLTKWFQKNDNHSIAAEQDEIRLGKHTRSTMAKRLKRRCLELSFKN